MASYIKYEQNKLHNWCINVLLLKGVGDEQDYDSLTQSNKSNIGLRGGNKILTPKVYKVRTQDTRQVKERYKENLASADTTFKTNLLQSSRCIITLF